MSFALFLCGPRVAALAELAPALVEELAGRGVAAQVLATAPVTSEVVQRCALDGLRAQVEAQRDRGLAVIVLLQEGRREAREAVLASLPDAVVVDWCRAQDAAFEPSAPAHAVITEEGDALAGLAVVFATLEGLGYLGFAERGALSAEQDAELLAKLKELGYV